MRIILFFLLFLLSCTTKKNQNNNVAIYKAELVESEKACDLQLVLNEPKRTYLFSGVLNADGSYIKLRIGGTDIITFNGLDYLEYDEKAKVSGHILQDTIIIQNYGNSMNEYTKINGCEEKYIYLVKQK